MSLIQEALEKAGRISAEPKKPVPVEEKQSTEVKVEKIPAPKTQPLWLVGVTVKLLAAFDRIRFRQTKNESRKTALMAAGIILFFLAVVFSGRLSTHSTWKPSEVLTPFEPPVIVSHPKSTEMIRPNFQLTGITVSGNTPLALINDQVVGVGEKLKEGAAVLGIQGQSVILDFQGENIRIEL